MDLFFKVLDRTNGDYLRERKNIVFKILIKTLRSATFYKTLCEGPVYNMVKSKRYNTQI
jgi:hypothetical protein